MKKIFVLMSAALMLTACGSDEPNLLCDKAPDLKTDAKTDNIVSLAQDAYETFFQNPSRSSMVKVSSVVPLAQTNSRSGDSDTLLYIVNMENNAGFVVVSDVLETSPILAVSDKGNIPDPNNVDNPGMEMYLSAAKEYISTYSGTDSVIPFRKHVIEYPYAPEKVGPRCEVEWGQQYPEGLFCPNTIAGCVPVATVQALSYFETPDTINLTYPDKDQDCVIANWKAIKQYTRSCSWSYYNNYLTDSNSGNSLSRAPIGGFVIDWNTPNEKNLGRICRELGHQYNANYKFDPNSTGVSPYNFLGLRSILLGMDVNIDITGAFFDTPNLRECKKNNPIMVCAAYTPDYDAGHAFIIDGYSYQHEEHYIYEFNGNSGEYDILVEQYSVTTDYQHINWGWNGDCNGYFNVGIFNPSDGEIYDNDTNYPIDYNFNSGMIYFILKEKPLNFTI